MCTIDLMTMQLQVLGISRHTIKSTVIIRKDNPIRYSFSRPASRSSDMAKPDLTLHHPALGIH